MNTLRFKNIVGRFLKGKASNQDKKILQEFENQMITKNKLPSSLAEIKNEIFENISAEILTKPTTVSLFRWKRWAAVASFLILAGVGFSLFFQNDEKIPNKQPMGVLTIATKKNEQQEILLEDGTKITLYGESTLTYPENFSEKIRSVSLSGEAFFEVAKNKEKPFVVTSQHIETQVLGTSFNIKAYEHQSNIKVTLTSGKVNVVSENQQVTLSPSEQVIYNKSSEVMTTQKIDLQEFTNMKNGILRFSEASLGQVAEKLEDFYNVKISLNIPQESRCQITGTFQKEKLDVVLRQIAFIHQGISYEKISDKHIVIKGLCNQK